METLTPQTICEMTDQNVLDNNIASENPLFANATDSTPNETTSLPSFMKFNEGHMLQIVVYSTLMVFSAIANTTVLVLIVKRRKKTSSRSRINTMLMHLAIADLLVTFLMMPLEIGWAATVTWTAGDAMCRIMAFFRTFGLYLSSFVLICISVDRFYAVLKPLHLATFGRWEKMMLVAAWVAATLCSTPQMIIFHVEAHPNHSWYIQCVTYNVFPSESHELFYSMFCMIMMYALPLAVIIYNYTSILLEIFRRTRNPVGADSITRSSLPFLGKAKIRTLKMTIIIVCVFFVCWTPYYVMCLWYWFDRESAMLVDVRIQKGLFLFACTNSCMNPIVYGVFNIRARRGRMKQAPDLNNSDRQSSIIRKEDIVCLVSWKKPQQDQPQIAGARQRRRDVCLSCGESFEFPVKTPGICAVNGK